MSVKVEHVTKLYGQQKALDNVSFEIQTGQVVGFLGPNGAGKSTMMKILTCFIPQTSGEATVCGYDITEQSMEVRKNVGYLPEHNPLYHDMYVAEYLSFIAGIQGMKRGVVERIKEMIAVTGLEIEQKKKIGALSKGYRQRVGLAQALVHNPKVLILDEPTSGLDPNQLSEIRNLIKTIGKEKTVILSTHIMQEVEAVCDRVLIISKGKIVADDDTKLLREKMVRTGVFVVEFDKLPADGKLKAIAGVKEVKHIEANRWKIETEEGIDIRKQLFQFAVQNDLVVLTLQKEEQRLEEIFYQLTGKIQT